MTPAQEEIEVKVSKFKHKETGEIGYRVMAVGIRHYVFDASEWERIESFDIEGVDRITKQSDSRVPSEMCDKFELLVKECVNKGLAKEIILIEGLLNLKNKYGVK